MTIIRVYLDGDGWMSDFVGDAETLRLFGTTVLPTPFLKATPVSTVMDVLAQCNPDATIVAGRA